MNRLWILLGCVAGGLGAGCAPSGDISGWELVPKSEQVAQMEVFPELPVQLPDTTPLPSREAVLSGPIAGVYLEKLDQGSLFRRGYSTPTP
ncbi:MAG: hypothetical protein ETSY1_25940 [Candidatus Entotheonella factor]|uniref:Uncharacterized protein n=1 Tax=Entotheonella factor TaxID=1429438 RepID=W4LFB5_ENTF1|nr:hypothetical protein [Candidatus Entotheonella palauensis]ETW96609.1 MAG: hypothetical protein ETSY1_25940 [Candidatus Entotheonella factor]